MKEIAQAFVKAQKEFAPVLKKSVNPAFKNSPSGGRYADLASCIDAVMDALNNNKIALIQKAYDCVDGIMVETVFVHESGETLECGILRFPTTRNDPQGFMSALTYARRGSLMAACGIAPEDDDGNAASKKTISAERMADHLAAIDASENKEELTKAYAEAFAACEGDSAWQAKVIAAKSARIAKAKK